MQSLNDDCTKGNPMPIDENRSNSDKTSTNSDYYPNVKICKLMETL